MMYLHTERSSHCFHINPSSVDDDIRWDGEMIAQWHVEPVQSFYVFTQKRDKLHDKHSSDYVAHWQGVVRSFLFPLHEGTSGPGIQLQ